MWWCTAFRKAEVGRYLSSRTARTISVTTSQHRKDKRKEGKMMVKVSEKIIRNHIVNLPKITYSTYKYI